MPAYDPKSRYLDVESYQVQDHRGRTVTVTAPAQAPPQTLPGVHLRRQGERPDHLAAQYLDDPMGFWRLAEANDAMQAEWLSEQTETAIPMKGR
jgi:hypothetical protein